MQLRGRGTHAQEKGTRRDAAAQQPQQRAKQPEGLLLLGFGSGFGFGFGFGFGSGFGFGFRFGFGFGFGL